MAETLSTKQRRFTLAVAEFIQWIYAQGFAVTFGEAWRTPEQARINAAKGKGIATSLHIDRLAIDLNLFRQKADGGWEWLSKGTEPEWELLAAKWESMAPDHAAGLRFGDANHFSIRFGNRK